MKTVCLALTYTSIVSVLMSLETADAAVIAGWDMTGELGSQVFTAGIGSPNVTAVDMVRGSGLVPHAGSNSLNSKDWDEASAANTGDDDNYIEFGFNVAPGFQVLFDGLFLVRTQSSSTGPGTMGLYTSVDNFALPVSTIVQPGSDVLDSAIDLSSLSPVTGSFRVRLIEIGNTQANTVGTTSSAGTFRVANHSNALVSFNGTTQPIADSSPIPEPSSAFVFAGLGLVAISVAGRRRTARQSKFT